MARFDLNPPTSGLGGGANWHSVVKFDISSKGQTRSKLLPAVCLSFLWAATDPPPAPLLGLLVRLVYPLTHVCSHDTLAAMHRHGVRYGVLPSSSPAL